MCDSKERSELVWKVRNHLLRNKIECDKLSEPQEISGIGRKARHGFWVTDKRWAGAKGGKVGFATACSRERPDAFREPHRLTPCFHLAPEFQLALNLQGETLIAMPQWYKKPNAGYIHLWFADKSNGSDMNIAGSPYSPELGGRVLRLLQLIRPVRKG